MIFMIVLSILLRTVAIRALESSFSGENETEKHFIYSMSSYDSIINVAVNETTTQILDFYEDSEKWQGYPTRVHVRINNASDSGYPLFVTAAQQKGVLSWELPLVVATNHGALHFDDMARTLCPHDAGPNITSQGRPTVTLATSNPQNMSLSIKLRRVQDFYLEVNKEVELNVTPSSPKYYYFSFDRDPWNVSEAQRGILPRFNYSIPKSVLLVIDSDDEICALVSIQNNSCPVFDNEKDILYKGYHFTMLSKGGITVTQSMFPRGFYVVFIVKESDEECTGLGGEAGVDNVWARAGVGPEGRVKNFRVKVTPAVSYSEYVAGAAAALALVALVAALAPLAACVSSSCTEEVVIVEAPAVPSTSRSSDTDTAPIVTNDAYSGESDAGSEEPLQQSLPKPLTLAGLSRARPTAHSRRSDRYFWSALTVAVVYALPVVQLLFTYQRMVFQTGDQDVCYYNFLCAAPLGPLADANHVLSNAGYVLLGAVFMLQAWCRQRRRVRHEELGIPQHDGLFYSMGLALVMEGVLSACYHLCPNKMNFQFDSSFMYVIAVLCMVKLYQNRHPDVNASAHATFMLIALLMAIGLFGICYPSVYFWVFFTILHLLVCFVLTLKIYYIGRFKLETSVVTRAWSGIRQHGWLAFKPNYTARAVLLAVANVANWTLAGYGLYEHNKDFARHLLAILMGNAILYTLFYVAMKVFHGERLRAAAVLYLALAHAAWALAAHLFLQSRTKWSQTAAMSRSHNAPCSALGVFDTHDLWHLASAAAIFFSFNALLTVDDPLASARRDTIPVF